MERHKLPGLHHHPTIADLQASGKVYNDLVEDHEQPQIEPECLEDLANLLKYYNADRAFGLHLAHRHSTIPRGTVMLGSRFNTTGWWTKPTAIESMARMPIHGHVYIPSLDNGLIAYEYRTGSPPRQPVEVDPHFFEEFTNYLINRGLHKVLALQVLEDELGPESNMLEIAVDGHGTVMINEEDAYLAQVRRVTGWIYHAGRGISALKGHEGHFSPPGGQHVVYTDGKLLRDEAAVMQLLVEVRIARDQYA